MTHSGDGYRIHASLMTHKGDGYRFCASPITYKHDGCWFYTSPITYKGDVSWFCASPITFLLVMCYSFARHQCEFIKKIWSAATYNWITTVHNNIGSQADKVTCSHAHIYIVAGPILGATVLYKKTRLAH